MPSELPAVQIAEQWNADARHVASAIPMQWNVQFTGEMVCTDMGLIRGLLKDALEVSARISGKRPLQIDCRCESGFAIFEIVALGVSTGARMNDSQQAYWTALRGLAELGRILMWPESLDPGTDFRIRISIPIHQPPS